MRRIQSPAFYLENADEVVEASIQGGMFLGIDNAESVDRHDVSYP
jgi:hypothetical protein